MLTVSRRIAAPIVRRTNLSLTASDEASLEELRDSEWHMRALVELSGSDADGDVTESVFLHAIFVAGLAAVRERAESRGYELLAADTEHRSSARAIARRRAPSWASEE